MLCVPNPDGWGECQAGGPRIELTGEIALPEIRIGAERAQVCFSDILLELHTEVPVYLTVDGASGRIEDARAGGSIAAVSPDGTRLSWTSELLGRCVAMYMATIEFPPLTQTRVGFWVPVRAYEKPKPKSKPDPFPYDAPLPPGYDIR